MGEAEKEVERFLSEYKMRNHNLSMKEEKARFVVKNYQPKDKQATVKLMDGHLGLMIFSSNHELKQSMRIVLCIDFILKLTKVS